MRLRMGDSDRAIATYLEHGRVTVTPTGLDARVRLVEGWMEARSTQTAVMLATRVADVDTLNRSARHRLQRAGVIGADEVAIGGRGFSAGDLVLALRNDNRLDVLNGTRAVIETIDPERQVIRCRTDDHRALTLPFDYASEGHLTHAYAMTVHKAQGATFDRCFVLAGDQLTRESAYTALSRARVGTDVYVVADDPHGTEAHTTNTTAKPSTCSGHRSDEPAHSPWQSNRDHRPTGSRRSPRTTASTSGRDSFASLPDRGRLLRKGGFAFRSP